MVCERDVMAISRVRQRTQLRRLLIRLAGQTAQLLNISEAARSAGLEVSTAENYTQLLESVSTLARRLGDRWLAGGVFYAGQHTASLDPRLNIFALPVDALGRARTTRHSAISCQQVIIQVGRTSHHANHPILIEGDPLPVHLSRSRTIKAER